MKAWGFFFLFAWALLQVSCSEDVPELPEFALFSSNGKDVVYVSDTLVVQLLPQDMTSPVDFSMYRLRLQPLNAADLPDSVPGLLTFLKAGALWVSESDAYSLPFEARLPVPAFLAPGAYLMEASLALLNGRQITDTLSFQVVNRQDTLPPDYDFLQSPPVSVSIGDTLKALMEFSDLLSNNQSGAVWRIDFRWKSGNQQTERRLTWPLNPYSVELPMPQNPTTGPSVFWFRISDAFGNQRTDSVTVVIF